MTDSTYSDSDQAERIEIEVIGNGWAVTHEMPHCTLGIKQKREVFLDMEKMILWIMECLNPNLNLENISNDRKQ